MPILYKVIKDDKESYLFGTIHDNHPDVLLLSPEAKEAFERSNSFMCEADSSINVLKTFTSDIDSACMEWKDRIKSEHAGMIGEYLTYLQIRQLATYFQAESGLSNEGLFDLLERPPLYLLNMARSLLMASISERQTMILDEALLNKARASGIQIGFLDQMEDLSKRIAGDAFNYQDQVAIFKDQFDKMTPELMRETKSKLVEVYLSGKVDEIFKSVFEQEKNDLGKQYLKYMFLDRDPGFVDRMKPYLNEGDAFIIFGALHLPGVVELLKKEGYEVSPVKESERTHDIQELQKINNEKLCFQRAKARLDKLGLFGGSTTVIGFYSDEIDDACAYLGLVGRKEADPNIELRIQSSTGYDQSRDIKKIMDKLSSEETNPDHVTFELDCYDLNEDAVVALAEGLAKCKAERVTVDFGRAKLTEKGLQALIDVLESNNYSGRLEVTSSLMPYEDPARTAYGNLFDILEKKGSCSFRGW